MIEIELKSDKENLTFRLLDDGYWLSTNSFVFVVTANRWRERMTRSFVRYKKLKAKRVRATIVRDMLKDRRRQNTGARISWKQIDDAYCNVMQADGVSKWWARAVRTSLWLDGTASKLWLYWRVPS